MGILVNTTTLLLNYLYLDLKKQSLNDKRIPLKAFVTFKS